MVSLDQQTAFFQRLNDSALQPLVQEIGSVEIGAFTSESANASDFALNLLISVKAANKQQAEQYYTLFSKRQPSKETHWIYDNYVLFCIVAAVVKFGFDTTWITNVINLSLSGGTAVQKGIKETFKNLLAGNYNAKNDYHQISLVYQFLSKDEHYQDDHINKTFNEIWLKPFPIYNEDFLDLMSLKAIEVAVAKKSLLTSQEQYHLKYFVPTYDRKIGMLTTRLSWLVVLSLIAAIFYSLFKLNSLESELPVLVKGVFFLLGISGAGVLAVWNWKKGIASILRKGADTFFRYKKLND